MADNQGTLKKEARIALIDDDLGFCKIMSSFAFSRGLALDYFQDLEKLGAIGRLADYAVVLVDYELDRMCGIEIAQYLDSFFENKPMILISGRNRAPDPGENWPESVKAFVHKDDGPDSILDQASLMMRLSETKLGSEPPRTAGIDFFHKAAP